MKNKNITSKFFTSLIITTFLISIANIAHAYSHIPGALTFNDQYNIEIIPTWNNEYLYTLDLNSALQAWNYSDANVWIKKTTSNSTYQYCIIRDFYFGNTGWHAKAYPMNSFNSVANIQINDSYTLNPSSIAYKNKRELIAHEIGHVLGLMDVSNTEVLMRNSGYKGSPNPTQDDIDGVNVLYN